MELAVDNDKKQSLTNNDKARLVFDLWQRVMKKPRAKLNRKREKAIIDRIKEGYEGEDFKDAILGCARSDFHMGYNDRNTQYNDIELICRNGVNLEKFIELNAEIVKVNNDNFEKQLKPSATQIATDTSWAE